MSREGIASATCTFPRFVFKKATGVLNSSQGQTVSCARLHGYMNNQEFTTNFNFFVCVCVLDEDPYLYAWHAK